MDRSIPTTSIYTE